MENPSTRATKPGAFETRIIVVPVLRNAQDEILLCRMAPDRGVFPGQWGLPGGGMERGERMDEALRREIREELGIEITEIQPLLFKDGLHHKTFPDGSRRPIYMVFLLFHARAVSSELSLNDEFSDHAWARESDLRTYDLNVQTLDTFDRLGL
ncbi:MAG: nucleoside triphosphatase NudI [Acidobacteria bacterium]|nr:nucleoside triphosphatase NudI [Acidobacteriota bacterium]